MAKKAILEVLSSTIGRYVHNLDADALNVAVWSGKIELSNLSLNIGAVNSELARQAVEAPNLAIPLRVVEGRFESLKVEVPWARITSRPVVLRARGLRIVVEGHDHLSGPHRDDAAGGGGEIVAAAATAPATGGAGSADVGARGSGGGSAKPAVRKRLDRRAQSLALADGSRKRANAVRKLAALDDEGEGSDGGGGGTGTGTGPAGNSARAGPTGPTFAARLVRRIAENLQLEIDSVHVSLRDDSVHCSAGVVLDSLSLFTTDARGSRTFVDRGAVAAAGGKQTVEDSFLYKELQIEGLGIYCDEDDVSPLEKMQQRLAAGGGNGRHSYILSPLSFTAKLRQSDVLRCVDFPKYLVTARLKSLSMLLSRTQLELGRKITASIAANKDVARPLFPEYRPALAVGKGTAKEWWRYAVRCIGRLNRRRSWPEFFIAYQKRKAYVALYKRSAHHATCPWLSKLTIAERAELDKLEQDTTISAQGIMCWRNIADAQMEREREKHSAAMAAKRGRAGVGALEASTSGTLNEAAARKPWKKLFGSAADNALKSEADRLAPSLEKEDEPPITLTVEEMRELEAIGINNTSEASALSADSMLCDIKFTLGSFRVNLVSYGLQPLTSLQMGTMATAFAANADGSFESRFTMASLQVDDMVTAQSLFPSVLRSLQSPGATIASAPVSFEHAFDFQMKKSKTGDRDLLLRMVAFEVVASSLLLKEVRDFFAVRSVASSSSSRADAPRPTLKKNPILQESVSGSVDLFYDADLGESAMPMSSLSVVDGSAENLAQIASVAVSDRLSAALTEAWSSKTQSKRAWTIECDIHAPILVLPESCVDREAPVLVIDLGNFHFVFGKGGACQQVQSWFDDHPRDVGSDSVIDYCSLEMKRLAFLVGKAGKNDWTESIKADLANESLPERSSQTVIEPVTLSLSFGIESNVSNEDKSRKCIHGVLPAITLQLSPTSVAKILSVYSKWTAFAEKMAGPPASKRGSLLTPPPLPENSTADSADEEEEGIEIIEKGSDVPEPSKIASPQNQRSELVEGVAHSTAREDAMDYLHFSIALRKLSARFLTDRGDGLEAHLVSVVVSSTLSTDGSSSSRLSMGWFWVFDGLQVNFPRAQRIIAHSNLPRSASDYAKDDAYETIMGDLDRQGVFKESYAGSSDLADIVLKKSLILPLNAEDPQGNPVGSAGDSSSFFVDAKFTALFVNWNPRTVKQLLNKSMQFDFSAATQTNRQMGARATPAQPPKARAGSSTLNSVGSHSSVKTYITINAQMKMLEVSLNSAIDDLPLYLLTMAEAKVDIESSISSDPRDNNISATFVVGDIRMETPATGKTLSEYKTILGLAPNQSTSLLTVTYGQGNKALESCTLEGLDKGQFGSFADIDLSPMRFVYIQAQVLTLVEYVTEGVLGTLTARVASSAAAAAIEMAQAMDDKDKMFHVKATGFDLVVPQAAQSQNYVRLDAGDLGVQYIALANDGGGKATAAVGDVTMTCSRSQQMMDNPIRMSIGVFLAPINGPTEEDRAIKVDIDISQATFLLTRRHYVQLMNTLEGNIGEANSFLRNEMNGVGVAKEGTPRKLVDREDTPMLDQGVQHGTLGTSELITHGGVELVIVQRHIYINFEIAKLAVELCDEDTEDTIVSAAAVETRIVLRLFPEEEKTCANVTLHDLVCEDRRLEALHRRFHSLVSQIHDEGDKDGSSSGNVESDGRRSRDVFYLTYTKNHKDETTDIDLTIGSPQVVVIPDCIAEVLKFVRAGARLPPNRIGVQKEELDTDAESVSIFASKSGGEIETSLVPPVSASESLVPPASVSKTREKMKVAIKTSNWRLVLVDMGSAPGGVDGAALTSTLKKAAQLTETVVIQGQMEATLEIATDSSTGEIIESDYEVHGENVEMYTAQGVELSTPVQVLEPLNLSVFYSTMKLGDRRQDIEIKAVTLSNIEVILSMQNVALMKAIVSSVTDSFAEANRSDDTLDEEVHILTEKEASRIERLASALDKNDESDADQSVHTSQAYSSIHPSYHAADMKSQGTDFGFVIRVKATVPETVLTVVNDLQGLDDALFKLHLNNFVFGGEFDLPPEDNKSPHQQAQQGAKARGPLFRFHVNTGMMADYFDAHNLLWESLLVKPWELHFNGMRAPQKRFQTNRLSTTFDIDSHPCYLSFSEQFLVSLGAASRMWSVYSIAAQKAVAMVDSKDARSSVSAKKSLAACAARSLITTMPYGIENHAGITAFFSVKFGHQENERLPCPSGTTQYFHFDPPPGAGTGGKRSYGQDVSHLKSLNIHVGDRKIHMKHVDAEVNRPRQAHHLGRGLYVFTEVVRDTKATVIHVSSHIDITNSTSLPFQISVLSQKEVHEVGTCHGLKDGQTGTRKPLHSQSLSAASCAAEESDAKAKFSRPTAAFGIPTHLLQAFDASTPCVDGVPSVSILISPLLIQDSYGQGVDDDSKLSGSVSLPNLRTLVQIATSNAPLQSFEVICTSKPRSEIDKQRLNKRATPDAMVVQVCCRVTLVSSCHPFVELFLQPRAMFQNNIPVSILVRTPMPHTHSPCSKQTPIQSDEKSDNSMSGQTLHFLEPFESVEIFTPGPSIAVTAMCADTPSGGRRTGWMDVGWVDLPLGKKRRLSEPINCVFPFVRKSGEAPTVARGSEIIIQEGLEGPVVERSTRDDRKSRSQTQGPEQEARESIETPLMLDDPQKHIRQLSMCVCNFAVDHTGEILFEQVANEMPGSPTRRTSSIAGPGQRMSSLQQQLPSIPFSSFSSPLHRRRITLLPGSNVPIRLIQLTMDGIDGMKRSSAFLLENIALCEGGVESTAIMWGGNKKSGFYAYRRLSSYNQCELHVIPEFVAFNGSSDKVVVKQPRDNHVALDPGKVAPIRSDGYGTPSSGLILMIEFCDVGGSTAPLRVDSLGIKICVVKSTQTGCPIGSVAVQTIIGSRDSRLVVKIGAIKYGGVAGIRESASDNAFADDFFRFRVRWSEFEVTLNDTQRAVGRGFEKNREALTTALNLNKGGSSPRIDDNATVGSDKVAPYAMVAQILFHRFTVDYQRIFKDDESAASTHAQSPERTQLAVVVHSVRITDCDPSAVSRIVLESPAKSHFFDLCIRTRGSHNADLVKVDLFDLNLAYADGKADRIVLNTGEEFVWRLLDVANRTLAATAQVAGVDLELEWDEEKGTFIVSTYEINEQEQDFDASGTYRPPQSDKMYDIRTARVSPIKLLVSFKRQPSLSRYQRVKGVRGAKLYNYITTRLKFTVDNADISFAGYVAKNIKGPPDRLLEMVSAVYSSRLKLKVVSMLNSVTLQDWRYLSGRADQGDEYVEGDILRLTGNLAGRSAGYLLKKVGQGLGDGVSSVTGTIGDGIENASEKVGAGAVGAGVNSIVSGVGEGVGSTVKGVGAGAGKLFRGVGKGLGQVVGGVGGGVQLAAKGIGKGVTTGDGKAVAHGFRDGFSSVGTGIGRGVETAALGTTDGVLAAGQGLVSGVSTVGKGIGGAFTGGEHQPSPPKERKQSRQWRQLKD